MLSKPRRQNRHGRSVLAVTIYLVGFGILVLLISHYYLLPALAVRQRADPKAQKILAAYALLIMLVVLFICFIGLLATFRIGRFFRPASVKRAKPTKYVDAWQESGRRLQVPQAGTDPTDEP